MQCTLVICKHIAFVVSFCVYIYFLCSIVQLLGFLCYRVLLAFTGSCTLLKPTDQQPWCRTVAWHNRTKYQNDKMYTVRYRTVPYGTGIVPVPYRAVLYRIPYRIGRLFGTRRINWCRRTLIYID